jgi:hypothetical protein
MPKLPTLIGEPVIIQEGPNVLLECIAEAQPAPTAAWTKDDKEIKEGDQYAMKIIKIDGAGTADKYKILCEIKNFDKPLGGVYKVTLKNESGQSAATFTVSAGDAPEFIEKPHIIQRDGGKVLVIKVKARSKVEPKIEWLKSDKEVKESDRVKFVMKKDEKVPTDYICMLEIKGPIKEDEAKYTCTVKNKDGSNSQSLNLAFD